MNIEWLKVSGYVLPVVAMVLNFAARFKTLTNERISIYKDIKPLCTAIEMKSYEIKAIDKEIKNLILFEATRIRNPLLAQQHLKILSCNDLTDIQKSRIKKLAHCIDQEANDTVTENKEIRFALNKEKYKKRRMEGYGFIITCLIAYYTFFFSALNLPTEDIISAIAMLVISLFLISIILVTIATYPVLGFYKGNKKTIDSLNVFYDQS
ncbi:hypothetical protein [Pantoea agglomerans]|uniref:hypothetical protein n=1 Tax=Enterobacter agglomerans TaxID=549 RepID=UPI0009BD67BF|nr:hypothetical protein [Pantoea agglomerans]WHU90612.1 hypothetical protein A7P62_23415 [Pantoea agglomerans pv. gypsophilae]